MGDAGDGGGGGGGSAGAVLDRQRLAGLQALGPDIVEEIVGVFLDTAPDYLSALRVACAGDDVAGVRQAAHGLRGSAGNLGFAALAAACEALEDSARTGTVGADCDDRVVTEWRRALPVAAGLACRSACWRPRSAASVTPPTPAATVRPRGRPSPRTPTTW